MKKLLIIVSIVFLCIVVIVIIIYIYLNIPRKIKIYEEYQVYSKRETAGLGWHIIINDEIRSRFEKRLGIYIPKIDFDKYYLLWSDGRRIKEINYTIGSKYKWWFDYPIGVEVFYKEHYPHTIFIYKIEKVIVLQESP